MDPAAKFPGRVGHPAHRDGDAPAGSRRGPAPSGFLTFRLGAEEYGIDILCVQEIRRYEAPTHIVGASACIKGVVNLRGVIVPIIDLRMKLRCASAEYNDFTVVIVLNVRGRVVGIVVDAVSDVVALDAADIKPPPDLGTAVDARFIRGIASTSSGESRQMLILADIEAVLGQDDVDLPSAA